MQGGLQHEAIVVSTSSGSLSARGAQPLDPVGLGQPCYAIATLSASVPCAALSEPASVPSPCAAVSASARCIRTLSASGSLSSAAAAATLETAEQHDSARLYAQLESRFAEKEEMLAQSRRKEGMLTEMLRVATQEIECLGEEADTECNEMHVELQAKQAELDQAMTEVHCLQQYAASSSSVPPGAVSSSSSGCDDGALRRALRDSQADCEALRSELSQHHAGSVEEFQRVSQLGELLQLKLSECDEERAALASQAGVLQDEARKLKCIEEDAWSRRATGYDRMAAEISCMQQDLHQQRLHHGTATSEEGSAMPRMPLAASVDQVSLAQLHALQAELGDASTLNVTYCNEVASLRHQLAQAEEAIGKMVMQSSCHPAQCF